VALVIESIEQWWAEHPLHAAGEIAEEASRRYVGPMARKNPVAVIVGSVVFGALLVASKPWRWLFRPALFIGLVPQIASHALKRMPLDTWLQMLSTFSAKRAANVEIAGIAGAGIRLAKRTLIDYLPTAPCRPARAVLGRSPSVGSLKTRFGAFFFSAKAYSGPHLAGSDGSYKPSSVEPTDGRRGDSYD
jgi:hypothetical protein